MDSDRSAAPAIRQRLGLCMIVRNEEKRLARCLASALPWVGEAVVVDTGSTDGTAALAESMGARVPRFAWCDDFARARNHALAEATAEWVLVLDADEVLRVDDADAWAAALASAAIAAYSIDCHDRIDDGGVAVGPVLRLFRRAAPDMLYRGEVHEQIVAVAERRCATAHARFIHIEHDGHTSAVVAEHRTLERNLRLARVMVASRPADPFAWFCLGQAVQAAVPESAEAISAFERALERIDALGPAHRDESYLAALWINLVRALARGGRARDALEISARALCDFPDSPDLRFLRGKLLLDAGHVAAATRELEECLSPGARRFFLRQDPGAVGYAAETQLAICCLKLGQVDRAARTLRQAAESAPPGYHLPRLLLGILLLSRRAPAEAEPLLGSVVAQRPQDLDARLHWARALLALGRRADAEAALAPLAGDPRATQLLAA
ncbi:MAG TPA: glycosyltransferase [Polyangia bacterium]|nr:glycosyltransferase [Polyangia bacterium]